MTSTLGMSQPGPVDLLPPSILARDADSKSSRAPRSLALTDRVHVGGMSMGAPGLIEGMVAEAGFRDVVTDRVTISHDIADPEIEWQAWRENFTTPDGSGLESFPRASNSGCTTTSSRHSRHSRMETLCAFRARRFS